MISSLVAGLVFSAIASAQTLTIQESIITDYRPVVGRIEASDTAMARSRLQGVITQLSIDEGQVVKAGEALA
ncbi:MAG: biotin/lipoyl-binding protein, partial [Hyphomonas sp.]|nr:biotin/lipoyl-binding protein [Hyphomonas sp.]